MGGWGGENQAWPDFGRNWGYFDAQRDRFGDAYRLGLQWIGSPFMGLFVEMDATKYTNSGGKRPGTWTAEAFGETISGAWRDPKELSRILKKVVSWATKLRQQLKTDILSMSNANWELRYDGDDIWADYRGPKDKLSDGSMYVSFRDPEDALIGNASSDAEINYSAGADYQGHFGEQSEEHSYSSPQDIRRILERAEMLFQQWEA